MNKQKERDPSLIWAVIVVIVLVVFTAVSVCKSADSDSRPTGPSDTTEEFQTTSGYTATATTTTATTTTTTAATAATTIARSTTRAARAYTYRRTTTAPKEDPFDAKDYVDADDFYFDHYDDFFDYEDAEDYWRENS